VNLLFACRKSSAGWSTRRNRAAPAFPDLQHDSTPLTCRRSVTLLNSWDTANRMADLSRLPQSDSWTIVSTMSLSVNYWANDKVSTKLSSVQQNFDWTSESTTKLLVNHLVYQKNTTYSSSLQQIPHWTIKCTTETPLNRRVYNKITAEPLSLQQIHHWTTEYTTTLLLNHWVLHNRGTAEQSNLKEYLKQYEEQDKFWSTGQYQWVGWYTGNTLYLHSGCVRFESQLGHRLYWIRVVMVFLSSSRQLPQSLPSRRFRILLLQARRSACWQHRKMDDELQGGI
jgi:hypothetical protein